MTGIPLNYQHETDRDSGYALRLVKNRLQDFFVLFAKAEFAGHAQEIIENVLIDNFAERSASRATGSTANQGTNDSACNTS
ncbi:hypothetical protein KIV45_27115 [Janthinobacterium lividum]|nr:hypothetical protein KIV45_27115 [Janthinobacterium lividum]